MRGRMMEVQVCVKLTADGDGGGDGELAPLLHVRLDGGERGGAGEREHYRAESWKEKYF